MRTLLQAKASETKPQSQLDRTRGFVVPEIGQEVSTSSLNAAVDRAARFGHNLSHLAPPGGRTSSGPPSNGPVQAQTGVGGVIQRTNGEDEKKPWISDKSGFFGSAIGLFGTGLGLLKRKPNLVKTGVALSVGSGVTGLYQGMGPEGRSNTSESIQNLTKPLPHENLGAYDMPIDPSTGERLRHSSMFKFSTNVKNPPPNLSSLKKKEDD